MGVTLLMPDHLLLFTDNSPTLHAIKNICAYEFFRDYYEQKMLTVDTIIF